MSSSSRNIPAHALVQNGVDGTVTSGSDASVLLVEKTLASQSVISTVSLLESPCFCPRNCRCFAARKCQALIMSSDAAAAAAVTSHFDISAPAGVTN